MAWLKTENIPPTKWRKNGTLPADDKERETCYTGIVPNWDKRKGRSSEESEGGFFAARNFRLEVVKWNVKHILPGCGRSTGRW